MLKTITSPVINFFQEQQLSSLAILRLVGYGLIAMAAIDYISLLIPLKLMNPAWEFQTVGAIIERVPIMLLGTVFVFFGETDQRTPMESLLLKCLSWFCLIFAIFLFITFPLNVINGFRLHYSNNAQVNQQFSSKIEAIDQFQSELQAAQSLSQINNILQQQSNTKVDLPNSIDQAKLKLDIAKKLTENQNFLESQAINLKANKSFMLLEQGIKWNLGALISACLFLFIWQHTFWARIQYEKDEE